jgi:hypothetical protein
MLTPLTSHVFPYHVEQILIPPSKSAFDDHSSANEIFGLRSAEFNVDKYSDDFWDTPHGDLHANSLTLRVRNRSGSSTHFINYKGAGRYIHQLLTARLFGAVRAESLNEVADFMNLSRASEPLQFLLSERPDLAGTSLRKTATTRVSVRSKHLFDGEHKIQVTITFHEYHTTTIADAATVSHGQLVEIQPTFVSGSNLQRFLPYFAAIIGSFVKTGYQISPVGKYQRIPRESIDGIHAQR